MADGLPTAQPPRCWRCAASPSASQACALTQVSLNVRPGEIHALLGENGAGKSTLMTVLAGVYGADAGEVLLSGRPSTLPLGIVTIYHELNLV